MDDRGVDPFEIGLVEAGGRATECAQVESLEQLIAIRDGLDGERGPKARKQGHKRLRFDPALAKDIAAERTKPL